MVELLSQDLASVIVSLILELSSQLAEWQSGRRVPLCDWLEFGVKVKSTPNADVDFCSKMASLTAVMHTNRSGSLPSSKKQTGMMTQRRFRLLDNNVLLFLSLASMLHCALADGKTLVLLDNLNIRDTHSIFFRSLAGQYDVRAFFIYKYSPLYCCRPPPLVWLTCLCREYNVRAFRTWASCSTARLLTLA